MKTLSRVLTLYIIQKCFLGFGVWAGGGKGKGEGDASMLSNLKSALRSHVFGKLKESMRESLKVTLWSACSESGA